MSNHTFIGITTALVEKWGVEHGCEHHRYLISQCHQLYEELQVRNSFAFVEYLHILSSSSDFLIHSLSVSGLPDKSASPAIFFRNTTLLQLIVSPNSNRMQNILSSIASVCGLVSHSPGCSGIPRFLQNNLFLPRFLFFKRTLHILVGVSSV